MAKLSMKPGSTSQSVHIKIYDSSVTTGAGLTGLAFNTASLTAYYCRTASAATAITLATQTATGAFSSGGFVAVDGTNMPGIYRLDIPDAAIATGARSVVIQLKGATNMAQCELEIDLNAETNVTHFNGTAGTFASGRPEVNTSHISGSAVSTSTAQIGVNVVNFGGSAGTFASGRPEVNTTHWHGSDLLTGTGAFRRLGIIDSGTAQAATGTSLQLRSAAAFADSELIGATAVVYSATAGAGQSRLATANVGSTDTITVDTWTTTPTGTVVYDVYAGSPASTSLVPNVNVTQISGDSTAADNLESYCDGTTPIPSNVTQFGGTNGTFASGRPNVNTSHVGGTSQTGRDIGASVLLSPGTGTGQLSITSGVVSANTTQLAGQAVTAGAGVTFPSSVASPTNITAGTITTVTNLTNAPTAGDFTATMKTSIGTAVAASAVASVTGNVGGNVGGSVGSVVGAVGSVTGNVGGNVLGSVASVTTVNDKTGYTLSAGGVDAIWDELQSGHTVAGTFGKFLDSAVSGVSTGGLAVQDIVDGILDEPVAAHAVSGSVGANLADTNTDVNAIRSKTDNMTFTVTGKVDANTQAINGYTISGTTPPFS